MVCCVCVCEIRKLVRSQAVGCCFLFYCLVTARLYSCYYSHVLAMQEGKTGALHTATRTVDPVIRRVCLIIQTFSNKIPV